MKEVNNKKTEWACRILLSVNMYLMVSGYINFYQTKRQLLSPLIPQSMVIQIAEPYFKASLICGGLFIVSLWVYFFNKKVAAIVLQSLGIITYDFLPTFFAIHAA